MFSSVLKHYFTEHTTAILPNFGAIIKTGTSYMYNEYLKYDDGKLSELVMQRNACSKEEAQDKLTVWITEIINILDEGKAYDLNEIGSLIKEDGKVVLKKASNVFTTAVPTVENTVTELPKNEVVNSPNPPILSSEVTAVEAVAHIQQTTDKVELIAYTRNETRKTVIDALNKRLSALNLGKSTNTHLPSDEINIQPTTQVEGITEKINIDPEPVTSEEEFRETVEDTQKEIEELIQLTQPLSNLQEEETSFLQPKDNASQAAEEAPKSNKKEIVPPLAQSNIIEEDPELVIALGVDKLEKEEKRRKKKRILFIVGLLFVLSGGGILGYLNKDYLLALIESKPQEAAQADTKQVSGTVDSSSQEVENNEEQVEIIETIQEEVTIIDEKPTPQKEIPTSKEKQVSTYTDNSSSGGDYWLIAGSFSVEENAKNLVAKLKAEGFSGAYMDISSGSLIKVVAGKYAYKTAADDALEQLKSNGNKGFVQKK
jgi:cell division septation protein DedD